MSLILNWHIPRELQLQGELADDDGQQETGDHGEVEDLDHFNGVEEFSARLVIFVHDVELDGGDNKKVEDEGVADTNLGFVEFFLPKEKFFNS